MQHEPATFSRLTQQQRDELLMEVVQQVGVLTKQVELLWNHVFDKLEGSGTNNQEDGSDTRKPKNKIQRRSYEPNPHTATRIHSNPKFVRDVIHTHTRESVPHYRAETFVTQPEILRPTSTRECVVFE